MEDFVTFELALKLREKGFREECIAHYAPTGGLFLNSIDTYDRPNQDLDCSDFLTISNNGNSIGLIDAPTISKVLKWLREEKKMYIEPCIFVDCDTDEDGKITNEYIYWCFSIMSTETGDMIYFEYERIDYRRFDTYEQAALAGIEYVLDNLI